MNTIEITATVENAIENDQLLEIDYTSVKGEHSIRTIRPEEFLTFRTGTVVVGWDVVKEAYRRFHLTSINTVKQV